jgi:hypothetical protein
MATAYTYGGIEVISPQYMVSTPSRKFGIIHMIPVAEDGVVSGGSAKLSISFKDGYSNSYGR